MKKGACLLVLILSATVLLACGGDDSDEDSGQDVSTYCPTGNQGSAGGGGEKLVVATDPSGEPKFKPTSLRSESGELTIELKNPSPRCHDLAVKAPDGELLGNTNRVKEGTANVALDLDPGKYVYYSTIPGEQDAGMRGTLTVE
jgi:plastocyanin